MTIKIPHYGNETNDTFTICIESINDESSLQVTIFSLLYIYFLFISYLAYLYETYCTIKLHLLEILVNARLTELVLLEFTYPIVSSRSVNEKYQAAKKIDEL